MLQADNAKLHSETTRLQAEVKKLHQGSRRNSLNIDADVQVGTFAGTDLLTATCNTAFAAANMVVHVYSVRLASLLCNAFV